MGLSDETHVPRLQRFYGGSPGDWLTIPGWLVEAYLEALPGLEASEALAGYTMIAVGTGNAKKGTAQRIVSQWKRRVRKPVAQRPGFRAAAAAVGIAVIDEPVKEPANE